MPCPDTRHLGTPAFVIGDMLESVTLGGMGLKKLVVRAQSCG